jgi:hypothetical protein
MAYGGAVISVRLSYPVNVFSVCGKIKRVFLDQVDGILRVAKLCHSITHTLDKSARDCYYEQQDHLQEIATIAGRRMTPWTNSSEHIKWKVERTARFPVGSIK